MLECCITSLTTFLASFIFFFVFPRMTSLRRVAAAQPQAKLTPVEMFLVENPMKTEADGSFCRDDEAFRRMEEKIKKESSWSCRDDEAFRTEEKIKKESSWSSSSNSSGFAVRGSVRGQWTAEEDRLLVKLVGEYGVRKWSQIAKNLVGRIGKQCRERWHNHLRPDIKKDTWTEEEERQLIQAHEEVGNRWAEIAKRIPGRSENSIKNHWNATKRRINTKRKPQISRRKSPKSQPSVLQEYIKSKDLLLLGTPNPKQLTLSGAGGAVTTTAANLTELFDFGGDDSFMSLNMAEYGFMDSSPPELHDLLGKEVNGCSSQICSDLYRSYFMDGEPAAAPVHGKMDGVGEDDDAHKWVLGCKDVDLLELISS